MFHCSVIDSFLLTWNITSHRSVQQTKKYLVELDRFRSRSLINDTVHRLSSGQVQIVRSLIYTFRPHRPTQKGPVPPTLSPGRDWCTIARRQKRLVGKGRTQSSSHHRCFVRRTTAEEVVVTRVVVRSLHRLQATHETLNTLLFFTSDESRVVRRGGRTG